VTSDDDAVSDISETGIDLEKVATQEEKEEALKVKTEANKAFVGEHILVPLNWEQLEFGSLMLTLSSPTLIYLWPWPYDRSRPAAQDYHHSIELFTKALSLDPSNPVFWTNRAMAKMKLEEYGGAALDATRAIELDKNNVKVSTGGWSQG
jgi:tetratricopeptide (TPR) repeat protein